MLPTRLQAPHTRLRVACNVRFRIRRRNSKYTPSLSPQGKKKKPPGRILTARTLSSLRKRTPFYWRGTNTNFFAESPPGTHGTKHRLWRHLAYSETQMRLFSCCVSKMRGPIRGGSVKPLLDYGNDGFYGANYAELLVAGHVNSPLSRRPTANRNASRNRISLQKRRIIRHKQLAVPSRLIRGTFSRRSCLALNNIASSSLEHPLSPLLWRRLYRAFLLQLINPNLHNLSPVVK